MFSIPSFSKLLVLAIIVAAVWFGFRLIGRLDQARKQAARPQPEGVKAKARPSVEETVRCPTCDAFVAARGATSCGRTDCPY
jgi:uncharacterized protein